MQVNQSKPHQNMKAIHYRAGDCVSSKENARFHLQKKIWLWLMILGDMVKVTRIDNSSCKVSHEALNIAKKSSKTTLNGIMMGSVVTAALSEAKCHSKDCFLLYYKPGALKRIKVQH